jgi:hypothetical protein
MVSWNVVIELVDHSGWAVWGTNWVWIPLKAWMSVCDYLSPVVLCVGRDLASGGSRVQDVLKECQDQETGGGGQGPTLGCGAIDSNKSLYSAQDKFRKWSVRNGPLQSGGTHEISVSGSEFMPDTSLMIWRLCRHFHVSFQTRTNV